MVTAKEHTKSGAMSLVLGVIGIILIFLLPIIFGDPSVAMIAIPFGVLAAVFGFSARKRGDGYGIIGLVLGVITLILAIVFLTFFTIAYVERWPLTSSPSIELSP